MRRMREKIQIKLNSMASILLDDIIIPGSPIQSGQESIVASFFDEDENRYTFNLSLTVSPKETEVVEPALTLSDQVAMILAKLTTLEEDVSNLKNYHLSPTVETSEPDPTEETPKEDDNNENEGSS